MIVSFSGIDSSGKTTQLDLLCKYCEAHGIRYKKLWSKARGTPGVVFLKWLVRRDKKMDDSEKKEYRDNFFQNPKKEKFLYIMSMLDLCWYWGLYFRLVSLFYHFVFCDRYLWDTYVEVTHDFPHVTLDKSVLWKVVCKLCAKPKVSFCFFVPAELSLQRDHNKNAAGIEALERKKSKIACYQRCAKRGAWSHIMDGQLPIDDLHQQILDTLKLN